MKKIIFNRAWAMPNAWTFQIKPIAHLLAKYVGDGKGWIDPYAGTSRWAEITNDHREEAGTMFHLEAVDFVKQLDGKYKGILFDPPYSYRQVSEHYQKMGKKVTRLDTSANFYNRVLNPIADKIVLGGIAISFGWNSTGFGKNRGFEIIEILLVNHGGHHNDTICTVERKIQDKLFL